MGNPGSRALARVRTHASRRFSTRLGTVAVTLVAAGLGVALTPPGGEPSQAALFNPQCGKRIAKPGGGAWDCVWYDNFSGKQLDRTKWRPLTSDWTGAVKTECRVNDPDNIRVANGSLRLTVRKEHEPFVCRSGDTTYVSQYTAGAVTTAGLFSQAYGRFEIRARFPDGKVAGLHSAIWMWPQEMKYGPASGEIDIAEFRTGWPDRVTPTVHYYDDGTDQNKTNWRCFIDRPEDWHSYALEWTPQTLTFVYDGEVCLVNDWSPAAPLHKPQPFDRPFFLVLNQSLAGTNVFDAATAPLPGTMRIDWVRVWS